MIGITIFRRARLPLFTARHRRLNIGHQLVRRNTVGAHQLKPGIHFFLIFRLLLRRQLLLRTFFFSDDPELFQHLFKHVNGEFTGQGTQ
jgi:hypothetical protein